MTVSKEPSVLIVILNYATFELTITFLQELKSKLSYCNYSIIVIDNNSPNESAKVLEEQSKKIGFTFIANKENTGYAAGNNVGIRYGINNGFDYSWILNNDVVLRDANVLTEMIRAAEINDQIACVGPKIYSANGEICPPYIDRLTFWNLTFGIFGEKQKRKQFQNNSRIVYRVYGCCMLLKNRLMDIIDCMDERTFLYGEEDILAERLLKKGYYSFYDASVSVTHNESSSFGRNTLRKKIRQIKENNKSLKIYLKEYRNYTFIAQFIIQMFRSIIILLR